VGSCQKSVGKFEQTTAIVGESGSGKTIIVIAHRLSTIANADNIIVMENGTIAEQGSHSQLVSAKGKYFDLWSRQRLV